MVVGVALFQLRRVLSGAHAGGAMQGGVPSAVGGLSPRARGELWNTEKLFCSTRVILSV